MFVLKTRQDMVINTLHKLLLNNTQQYTKPLQLGLKVGLTFELEFKLKLELPYYSYIIGHVSHAICRQGSGHHTQICENWWKCQVIVTSSTFNDDGHQCHRHSRFGILFVLKQTIWNMLTLQSSKSRIVCLLIFKVKHDSQDDDVCIDRVRLNHQT